MEDSPAKTFDLTGATAIPGDGREPTPATRIEIENGRIAGIVPNGARRPSVPNIDLGNRWLLPGLIDCHVHAILEGGADQLGNYGRFGVPYFTLMMARHVRQSLLAGITTLRDMGGMHGLEFDVRRAIRSGLIPGPRLLLSGAIVTATSPGVDEFVGMYRPADGIAEVRKACREQLSQGADLIKIQVTGSVSSAGESPDAVQMALDEVQAAVETAAMQGKFVASHCHGSAGIRLSLEAGCRTIEHCTSLDEETADSMARHWAFMIPTLTADMQIQEHGVEHGVPAHIVEKSREAIRTRRESLQLALSKGVRIAMGTDAGTNYNRHGENAQELVHLVRMSLSPMQAITTATANAANACGIGHQVGTIETGKIADLIVLDQDPLADIAATRDVKEVFQAGSRIDIQTLRALDAGYPDDNP